MRREGFEMGVSGPEVIVKEVDGKLQEPYENVVFDIEEEHQGAIMEQVGLRKGEMTNMELDGKGRMRIEATVPARGLINWFPFRVSNPDFRNGHHDVKLLTLRSTKNR